MDYRKLFNTKYLNAFDVEGGRVVTIKEIRLEEVESQSGKEVCPIMYFHEATKGMVMGKTKGNTVAKLYGNEVDNWLNKPIELFDGEAMFKGQMVPAILVRSKAPMAPTVIPQASPPVAIAPQQVEPAIAAA